MLKHWLPQEKEPGQAWRSPQHGVRQSQKKGMIPVGYTRGLRTPLRSLKRGCGFMFSSPAVVIEENVHMKRTGAREMAQQVRALGEEPDKPGGRRKEVVPEMTSTGMPL